MIAEGITSVSAATAQARARSEAAAQIADQLNRSGAELTKLVNAFRI